VLRRRFAFLSTLLIFHVAAPGQSTTARQKFQIQSSVLKESRSIFIARPAGYQTESDRYPVLYLLDGETHFEYVAGMAHFLAENDRIPELIVVGIASGDSAQRRRDLTTPTQSELDERFSPGSGGADHFLKFLSEDGRAKLLAFARAEDVGVIRSAQKGLQDFAGLGTEWGL